MLKSEGSNCSQIDNSSDWTEIMRQLNLKAIKSRAPPIAYYTASANDTIRFRRQIRVSKHLCSEGRGYVCHRPAATGHGQEKDGKVVIQYKMMFRSEGKNVCLSVHQGCYLSTLGEEDITYESAATMSVTACAQVCYGQATKHLFMAIEVC